MSLIQVCLQNMPPTYVAHLAYDPNHLSFALLGSDKTVIGGIVIRPFPKQNFAEIVFCVVDQNFKKSGYGAHIMAHLKDYVKATSEIEHRLTYADNNVIKWFQRQGFSREITLDEKLWKGYIKDYNATTLLQCNFLPNVRYLEEKRMLRKQHTAYAKMALINREFPVQQPPKQWQDGVEPIDAYSIPAIRASGWTPAMDAASRECAEREARGGSGHYQTCRDVLDDIRGHGYAGIFLQPVDEIDVSGYHAIITSPMDLATMDAKLENGSYETLEVFISDFRLMINNCKSWNMPKTVWYRSTVQLDKYFWGLVKEIPEWEGLKGAKPEV